ncbi:MAG: hypothetical protein IPP38_08150 [Bacteroidetes bacterium]|nr:hypothetical protein [Bacteroidota bacterium]
MNKNPFLSALLFLSMSVAGIAQDKSDPVILNIAGENIPKSEFERVFKRTIQRKLPSIRKQ